MLTILILILLGLSTIIGYHRGFIAGLVSLGSYIISFWLAWHFAHLFSQPLLAVIHNIDSALINGVAFFITFLVSYLVIIRIGRIFKDIAKLPLLHQIDGILGAIIGFLFGYLLMFIGLEILFQTSEPWFISQYVHSSIAQMIVNQTPIITHEAISHWLNSK